LDVFSVAMPAKQHPDGERMAQVVRSGSTFAVVCDAGVGDELAEHGVDVGVDEAGADR